MAAEAACRGQRMGDIKLFRVGGSHVEELAGTTDTIEKSLQIFIEKNLEALLGVRLLASEFTTSNGGRIDTLGLDENGCPVILEYKRSSNENVINQGLFYLDWLMDHRKDFQWFSGHRSRSPGPQFPGRPARCSY